MTKETIEQVLKFRDERNWKQFHNPKDLAISICLEAAEEQIEEGKVKDARKSLSSMRERYVL